MRVGDSDLAAEVSDADALAAIQEFRKSRPPEH